MSVPWAYYNEHEPYAAEWLRALMRAGHIAPGIVDERDIRDVLPEELEGFRQCHFFAGIGVWSYALRRAGWDDERAVWTGSCPCQPFSAAGRGDGFSDERHLWPAFGWLVGQLRPAVVLGEQVASKAVDAWVDLVHADLEGMGYAFGCVPFPSASVGAPHIRDRAYWVAHSGAGGLGVVGREEETGRQPEERLADKRAALVRMGNTSGERFSKRRIQLRESKQTGETILNQFETVRGSETDRLDDSVQPRHQGFEELQAEDRGGGSFRAAPRSAGATGATRSFWSDADWLYCRDGRYRPVEPGTFPLAHGAPSRVGRLRAYGNALNAEAATAWVSTVMDVLTAPSLSRRIPT